MFEALAQSTYTYTTTTVDGDAGGELGLAVFGGFFMIIWLAVLAVMVVSYWKIFTKAGREGWISIIPFYNTWTLAEIVGKPGWWGLLPLLMVIPIINFIAWIPVMVVFVLIAIELAKVFGKDSVFAILLILLPVVGFPILAFSDAKYKAPAGAPKASA
jgi:hypothetical protein